ncbi:hypothetical protein E0485_23640 [Paenibacillus albiflavus]|uniref:Uncharacterized protein n=1 Tax=Paenibacillus albiflavus TaxID=2545760 RepID=A0A4R4E2P6_9BACL|nr:hypothetical protein [Paenibacillus albiflavus]TCZ69675.1 hypothetical protein E0485_23640 [Paenibacillus albiflavus]
MLILLEGLPGAGKSTNSGLLYRQFERHGYKTRWVHEMERPHPVLFFQEACLSIDEYKSWIERHNLEESQMGPVVQIRNASVGVDLLELAWHHQGVLSDAALKELQDKDVWKFTIEEYMEAALEKWRHFAHQIGQEPEQVALLDSCIFQYQIFSFQLANAPKQALDQFVQALWEIVLPLDPRIIFLYRASVDDAIEHLRQARGESFFKQIWERDRHRPYYTDRPDKVESYFEFLVDFHHTALELLDKAPCPKLPIEVTAGDWPHYEREMLTFCDLTSISDAQVNYTTGEFVNKELGFVLQVQQDSNGLTMIDPNGNKHRLHPRSATELYIHDLPVLLNVSVVERIVIEGANLLNRWTETGLVFTKTT